jgi:NADH dehydrogenase/NADH:ubiquinone oxidoreductase subunit G
MADLDGDGGLPRASIGNYKGVMLCNRPNEFGQVQKPERQGKAPFISRVDPKEQIGLNPTKKIINVPEKKKDSNSILTRHKRYLKMLQEKKLIEKLENENEENQKKETMKKFKEQTAQQRKKIKNLKTDKQDNATTANKKENPEEEKKAVAKLTKENLARNEEQYSQKSKASKKADKKKPAWAKTEQQLKQEEDEEIDDLIEFAYDLDYEKYMEDLEVRQALALIKERVEEIKKDEEWRTKIAQEWNEAEANPNEGSNRKRKQDDDAKSVASIRTSVTGRSKMSKRSELMDEIKREERHKEDWDTSTQGDRRKPTLEEKLASKLADQILENNPNLKGIHSKVSMRKMLEKEAARQLLENDGGGYQGPKVSTVKDHEMRRDIQASNLPYLHKNPAI